MRMLRAQHKKTHNKGPIESWNSLSSHVSMTKTDTSELQRNSAEVGALSPDPFPFSSLSYQSLGK